MNTTNMMLVTLAIITPAATYALCECLSQIVGLIREMRK